MPSSGQKYSGEKCHSSYHYFWNAFQIYKYGASMKFWLNTFQLFHDSSLGGKKKMPPRNVMWGRNISLNFCSINPLGLRRDTMFPSQQENRLCLHLHLGIRQILYPKRLTMKKNTVQAYKWRGDTNLHRLTWNRHKRVGTKDKGWTKSSYSGVIYCTLAKKKQKKQKPIHVKVNQLSIDLIKEDY